MLITDFDREIDKLSNNPGVHIFGKLISGMYMGRLAAEVLASLINRGIILKTHRDHKQSYRYYAPFHALYMLQTSHISEIELGVLHFVSPSRTPCIFHSEHPVFSFRTSCIFSSVREFGTKRRDET
jgi:hexokinase